MSQACPEESATSQACPERCGDIGAYIVGALDRRAEANLRAHLTDCTPCREEYENLLPVRQWLSRLAGVPGMWLSSHS